MLLQINIESWIPKKKLIQNLTPCKQKQKHKTKPPQSRWLHHQFFIYLLIPSNFTEKSFLDFCKFCALSVHSMLLTPNSSTTSALLPHYLNSLYYLNNSPWLQQKVMWLSLYLPFHAEINEAKKQKTKNIICVVHLVLLQISICSFSEQCISWIELFCNLSFQKVRLVLNCSLEGLKRILWAWRLHGTISRDSLQLWSSVDL